MSATRLFRIFLVLVVLSLLEHAWLARYCHPMGDDWSYAVQGMTKDFGPWLAGEYQHWNGRYFSNILVGKGPLVLGLDHLWLYRLVPVALIALTLLAAFAFVRSITRTALSTGLQWSGALVFTALFMHGMPDIGEGFYWYTGAVTYQFANVLLLTQLASLANFLQGRYLVARTPHALLNLLLALMVVGSSEVHMIMLLAIHAVILFLHLRSGARTSAVEWVAIVVVVLGASVMFFAPGNVVRASNFPEKHQLLRSLWMSLLQTGRFGLTWISDASLVLLSLLYLPLSSRLAQRVPLFRNSFHLQPLWSSLALGAVIFLCVFPAYWNTGILGQHRTVNVAYCFFLPLWFINLTVWSNRFPHLTGRVPVKWTAALLALAAIHMTIGRNSGLAAEDLLTDRAERFDRQLQQRYDLLEHARSTQDEPIALPAIKDPAKSLYILELRPDPGDWVNNAYVHYFRLDGRHIVPTTSAGSELR